MVMCVPVSSLVGKSQKTVAGGALGKPPCKRLQSNLLLFLRTTLPQAPVHISLFLQLAHFISLYLPRCSQRPN
jgi:hypothetical protein